MGLDMCLYAKVGQEEEEIGYWRKHADLNNYIIKEIGGQQSDGWSCGNGEDYYLTKEDIEEIIELSKNNSMKKGSGYFWGESDDYKREQTIKIMTEALKYIDRGYEIIYNANW